MDVAKLQAWWAHRQGLDRSFAGQQPAAALDHAGWMRSVGGSGPYLGLFARCGARRDAVDRAAAAHEVYELPAARGCTYVVPRRDFALALRVGQAFAGSERKVALSLGVSEKELDQLAAAVLDALRTGPLDPEQLREAVGGASRSLGEPGKKKGLSHTLAAALGPLQSSGEIRRIPVDGRLDRLRYRYELWRPNPLAAFKLSPDEAYTDLAARWFAWTGPATIPEFQWFSGLGVKAARQAVEPLGLIDMGDGLLASEETAREFARFRPPAQPAYSLVGSVDNLLLLRRNIASLIDPADFGRLPGVKRGAGLQDLPSHAIVDRGRVVGLWEYDPERGDIAWMSFVPAGPTLREAVARTERFIREDLGDARSFSLDSPKSRAPRIAALRAGAV